MKSDVQIAAEMADETQDAAEFASETKSAETAAGDGEFDAARAPFLAENDLIVVEGKGMTDGKVIS